MKKNLVVHRQTFLIGRCKAEIMGKEERNLSFEENRDFWLRQVGA